MDKHTHTNDTFLETSLVTYTEYIHIYFDIFTEHTQKLNFNSDAYKHMHVHRQTNTYIVM